MSDAAVREIVDRWIADADFRAEMFWNAQATMHRTHLDIEWSEFVQLRDLNWRLPAEELEPQLRALVPET